MKEYKVIIWDFNGTLIDDVKAALESVNDMLRRRNLPLINMEQYASYVDTPIIKFYEHIFDDLYSMDFGEIAIEFNEGYEKHLPQRALWLMPKMCLNILTLRENSRQLFRQLILIRLQTD